MLYFIVCRVAGNAAYILGTLAESEHGCFRVLSVTSHPSPEARRILPDLTKMLLFDDAESVMNAAGTMGTLVAALLLHLAHLFRRPTLFWLIRYFLGGKSGRSLVDVE